MIGIPFEIQTLILFGLTLLGWTLAGIIFFTQQKRIKKLYGGSKTPKGDMGENMLRRTAWLEAKSEELEKRIEPLERISKLSIQKVGFLRFNPFQDTGGDNSFALALLDHENDGVIISSFYTREGVRIYAKWIEKGNSKQNLSQEEKKVLEDAITKGEK